MFGSKNHTLSYWYWCVCCKSSLDLFIIHLRRQTSEFDMYQTMSRVSPIHIGLTIVLWNRLDVPAINVITLFFTNRNSYMLIRLPRIPKLLAPSSLLLLSSMVFSRTNSIRSFWKKAMVHVQSDQLIWSHTIRILSDSSSHIVSALITDCSSKLNLPIRNNHTQIVTETRVGSKKNNNSRSFARTYIWLRLCILTIKHNNAHDVWMFFFWRTRSLSTSSSTLDDRLVGGDIFPYI